MNAQLAIELCQASQLCDCELELGAIFPPQDTFAQQVTYPDSFFYYTEARWNGDTQLLDVGDLKSVYLVHQRLTECRAAPDSDHARKALARLFEKFASLSAGRRHGELALLGHCALLEGLITHDPQKSGDSLTHQISTKMALLMQRFTRPLALSDYIEEADPIKAWKKLYGYRSRIAHGGPIFSQTKDYSLRDPHSAFKLVRESLKRVFLLALNEPEFVFALKAC